MTFPNIFCFLLNFSTSWQKLYKRPLTSNYFFLKYGLFEGGIYLSHDIIINDWIHKGQTNLNMFQFFVEKIRAQAGNSKSWTFETDYTPKLHFYVVWQHKRPPHNQTTQFWDQVWKHFKKLSPTQFFWDRVWGGKNFYLQLGVFLTRESALGMTGWILS